MIEGKVVCVQYQSWCALIQCRSNIGLIPCGNHWVSAVVEVAEVVVVVVVIVVVEVVAVLVTVI